MKGEISMGRDNKQGKGNSKIDGSLPQTPKNEKIAPNKIQEEFSRELDEIDATIQKNKKK